VLRCLGRLQQGAVHLRSPWPMKPKQRTTNTKLVVLRASLDGGYFGREGASRGSKARKP